MKEINHKWGFTDWIFIALLSIMLMVMTNSNMTVELKFTNNKTPESIYSPCQ